MSANRSVVRIYANPDVPRDRLVLELLFCREWPAVTWYGDVALVGTRNGHGVVHLANQVVVRLNGCPIR